MKVADVTQCVAGRGVIAVVDGVPADLHQDDTLVRKSDGRRWGIQGMEYVGYRKGNDKIGFVLGAQAPPEVGDELTYDKDAVTLQRLHRLCQEQQRRIERLELALVLQRLQLSEISSAFPAEELIRVSGLLNHSEHVWLQPMKDSEGVYFLRVESSKKKDEDDGGT